MIEVVFALAGVGAATLAAGSYLRVLLRGESNPHWVSWLVWTVIGATAAWATYDGGAGALGLVVPVFFVLVTFAVFLLSFRRSRAIVTRWDVLLGTFAVATLVVWKAWSLPVDDAAIAAVLADACALYPTIRSASRASENEPITAWLWSAVAGACGLLALDAYSFASLLYLVYVTGADLAIAGTVVLTGRVAAAAALLDAAAADDAGERVQQVEHERAGALVREPAGLVEPLLGVEHVHLGLDDDVRLRREQHLPERELAADRAEVPGRSAHRGDGLEAQ
jgi:hypothetical protein